MKVCKIATIKDRNISFGTNPTDNLVPPSLFKSPMHTIVDGPVDISCQEFLDVTASIFGSVRGLFVRRFNNSFPPNIVGEIEREIRC